jgi:hypothetical protein
MKKNNILAESAEKQKKTEDDLKEAKKAIQDAQVGYAMQGAEAIASLMKAANKDSVAALVVEKTIGAAKIGMNTAIGISNAIAQFGPPPSPMGIVGIAAATAIGVAALASLIATSIPSAETGGSFIANGPPGVDTNLMKINNGERVDVIPAGQQGESSGNSSTEGLQSFKDYFWELVNDGFRRGAIYAVPGGNL